ncbi:MAG: desulfoferrodoxin [Archaeoglobaceae archaeon]
MTEVLQVYRCSVCGNVVEVLHSGVGRLVCCGKPMVLMEVKREDEGKEKHLPVVEREGDRVVVKVGGVPHPMEEDHYIEWIEVIDGICLHRKHLKPGDEPRAEFVVMSESIKVRAYCNVHGLWQTEV